MIKNLAIIMDGNGRWGLKHFNNRNKGHKEGVKTLEKMIENCMELEIKSLTVYAFSTENWKRPKLEIDIIMKLFKDYLKNKKEELNRNGIKLIVSGSKVKIPKSLLNKIYEVEEYLKENNRFTLNICFNYGGRLEIVETVNKLLKNGEEITEESISRNLYANELLFPDLIIRTGGDIRLSNFLIWQSAYSELYFSKVLWPDFNKEELLKAISEFSSRNRRFGGLDVK